MSKKTKKRVDTHTRANIDAIQSDEQADCWWLFGGND